MLAGEEVVGVAMRTAPFVPHPTWVHQIPDDAAVALARPTLFTDQANPVSNRIYQALGYEALADTANLRLTTPGPV